MQLHLIAVSIQAVKQMRLAKPLLQHLEAILTTSSIPATSVVVRWAIVARTAAIGRLRRTRLTAPTTCAWIRLTSTQAHTPLQQVLRKDSALRRIRRVAFLCSCRSRSLRTRVPSILRIHIVYSGAETLDIACQDGQYTLDIAFLAFCDVKKLGDFEASNSAIIDI